MAKTVNVPPLRILLFAVAAGLIVAAALVYLNLQIAWLGLQLEGHENGIRVVSVHPQHPNSSRILPGDIITAIQTDDGQFLQLQADDLLREPDVLLDEGAYEAFMERQGQLYGAYADGSMDTRLAGGERVNLITTEKLPSSLPWMFWLELLLCLISISVGASVWAFRKDTASAYFFLSGIAFLVCVSGETMYGTREFALPAGLFRTFSLFNSAGALVISAALVSFMSTYPRRLAGKWLAVTVFVLAALTLLESRLSMTGHGLWLMQVYIFTCFIAGVAYGAGQWLTSRQDPVAHSIARWTVSIVFLGTGLFAAIIVMPVLFATRHLASQGMMFAAFLIIYLGIAVGVARYRVFDLDLWWFRAWGWFLGGLAVLLLDAVLLLLFNLGELLSLSISLAVVGWLYFPLRQWFWHKFMRRGHSPLEAALPELIDALFSADTEQSVRERWPRLLQRIYSPLAIEPCPVKSDKPAFADNGTRLRMPPLGGGFGFDVVHASGGSRLFNREDLRTAELLLALMHRAIEAVRARKAGAEAERARIRRDMHDDLGAQLLDMSHELQEPSGREKVRKAIASLRAILTVMGEEHSPLTEAFTDWRREVENRLSGAGINLEWHNQIDQYCALEPRQRANLGRILREATSNIIRHSRATEARFDFLARADFLAVEIADNGQGIQHGDTGRGLGLSTMQERVLELGGSMDIDSNPDWPTRIQIKIPITSA